MRIHSKVPSRLLNAQQVSWEVGGRRFEDSSELLAASDSLPSESEAVWSFALEDRADFSVLIKDQILDRLPLLGCGFVVAMAAGPIGAAIGGGWGGVVELLGLGFASVVAVNEIDGAFDEANYARSKYLLQGEQLPGILKQEQGALHFYPTGPTTGQPPNYAPIHLGEGAKIRLHDLQQTKENRS